MHVPVCVCSVCLHIEAIHVPASSCIQVSDYPPICTWNCRLQTMSSTFINTWKLQTTPHFDEFASWHFSGTSFSFLVLFHLLTPEKIYGLFVFPKPPNGSVQDDTKETRQFERPEWPSWKRVRPCPFRDPTLEEAIDRRENGIIIAKMCLGFFWTTIFFKIELTERCLTLFCSNSWSLFLFTQFGWYQIAIFHHGRSQISWKGVHIVYSLSCFAAIVSKQKALLCLLCRILEKNNMFDSSKRCAWRVLWRVFFHIKRVVLFL